MTGYSPEETEMLENFRKLDETEKVIFLKGIEALGHGRITPDQVRDRVLNTIASYRTGKELTLSDLNAIGIP